MAKPRLLVDKPYVEIGGVKWATMNIGANSETDYGLYFQWGDTTGYAGSQIGTNSTANKKPFYWQDCVLHNGTTATAAASFTKYNGNDNLTVLEQCNDAATMNWGGNWRMPTMEEFTALDNAVNITWTTDYNSSGVPGCVFTDKTDSSKVLFFPAAGYCGSGNIFSLDSMCYYLSSLLDVLDIPRRKYIYFGSGCFISQDSGYRCLGGSVRPILDT